MKEETIDILKFGAFMAVLSVLIVYVVQSVLLGKQIQSKAIDNLNEIQINTERGSLKELNDQEIIVPAATVLALLEYNYKSIGSVLCFICDSDGEIKTVNESFCITRHLKGNVRIYVKYDTSNSLYDLTIRSVSY
ncbi:hypothetical protein [Clostridium sp. Marseille-P299]|uniref:hypothetical protein n=1 Tax=Clostridium sp. Marseille-P299 TaxID=1805477 RepID=UPI000831B9EF|nr:hypothetical protein [Clostridium sp. Marseille-P299]